MGMAIAAKIEYRSLSLSFHQLGIKGCLTSEDWQLQLMADVKSY